ncbi:MAG: hypothetical protein C0403_06490, partial [Desulfobacterium sp.]|nr:hypothetical protein [Desulfobacterium sp.]
MDDKQKWIMLVYKLPKARTSAGKVALWRKLKKLGVYQIQDSVCILPLSEKNTEDFEWIAAEVVEMGGDASVWTIVALSPEKEKKARNFFLNQVNSQYQKMIKDIETVTCKGELKKKWAYFHRIKSQDHLKSPLTVE